MARDYTTGTEVDPNNRFTVTSSKITAVDLQRDEDAYIYFDDGVDHYDGDFTHLVSSKTESTADASSVAVIWTLANLVDDAVGIETASGDALLVSNGRGGGGVGYYTLREIDGGTTYDDSYVDAGVVGTQFWLELERDETIGTYGTMIGRIYSDSQRTIPVDTLTITLHTSKKDYRYNYGIQSFNSSTTQKWDGFVEGLDIQEANPGRTFFFFQDE